MIEVKDLSFGFGKKKVLDRVDFTVEEGSVTGLVGINGAGKSTLLRLISGVYTAKTGEILCDGEKVSEEITSKKIFFLPDDPYFTAYTTGKSLYEMYKVFYPHIDRAVFEKYMKEFSLNEKKPIRNFSKGMRRQLFVALALAVRPKYLLLDEAFDGLDPLARLAFKRAINRAVEEDGTTVIISSHSLRELEDFCDSYILLDNQKVASSGSIADRVGSFCKFQLAFADGIPENAFEGLPQVSLEQTGRFVRIVLEGNDEEMREALEALSPTVIEQMPMDFEEMFICEVERRGYGREAG